VQLSGNTILITGGGSGIGLGLAAALLELKNTVIVTGRDAARLDEAKRAYPGLITRRCDVTRDAEQQSLIDDVLRDHPGFNVLINNAGVMHDWNVLDTAHPVAKIEQEIATNLTAPVKLIQLALPHLLKQPHAAVVNVSSGVAYAPLPKAPVYSATKAALHSFTRSLRIQLEGTPVKVFEVAPGLVKTAMSGARYDKPESFMTPETFARSVIKGLARDVAEIRPGEAGALYVLTRFAPDFASRLMNKKTRGELPKA
jgi:uncharacterized oxidoreductase